MSVSKNEEKSVFDITPKKPNIVGVVASSKIIPPSESDSEPEEKLPPKKSVVPPAVSEQVKASELRSKSALGEVNVAGPSVNHQVDATNHHLRPEDYQVSSVDPSWVMVYGWGLDDSKRCVASSVQDFFYLLLQG